jgi:hypothetical protein
MAANSSAHPSKAGFNQSGGAHFIIMTALDNTYINKATTAGSSSGGAFVQPTFALAAANDAVIGLGAGDVAAGKLLRDMGKSVVSSGRVFRRFQSVGSGAAKFNSTFGVNGAAPSAANAGYGTFYLEVGREGQGTAAPAPILRYF